MSTVRAMNGASGEAGYHLVGWILFIVCASLFLLAALRDGDSLLVAASLVFLTGCIAFLIPLLMRRGHPLPPVPDTGQHDDENTC